MSVSPGCSLCGLTPGETSDSSTLKASTSVSAAAFRIATSSVAVSPEAEGCTRRPSGLRGTSWLGRGRPRPRREAAVGIHSAMALRAANPGRRFPSPPQRQQSAQTMRALQAAAARGEVQTACALADSLFAEGRGESV